MPYPADIPGSQRVYLSDPATGQPYGSSNPIPTGSGASAGTTPAGHEFINDLSTSKPLTPPQAGTITALVIPNGAGIYYRLDGVAPTAAEGMPLPVGGFLRLESAAEIAGVRILQQATGGKISVAYGK